MISFLFLYFLYSYVIYHPLSKYSFLSNLFLLAILRCHRLEIHRILGCFIDFINIIRKPRTLLKIWKSLQGLWKKKMLQTTKISEYFSTSKYFLHSWYRFPYIYIFIFTFDVANILAFLIGMINKGFPEEQL